MKILLAILSCICISASGMEQMVNQRAIVIQRWKDYIQTINHQLPALKNDIKRKQNPLNSANQLGELVDSINSSKTKLVGKNLLSFEMTMEKFNRAVGELLQLLLKDLSDEVQKLLEITGDENGFDLRRVQIRSNICIQLNNTLARISNVYQNSQNVFFPDELDGIANDLETLMTIIQ